jgi:predicted glycosyltransferase
VTTALQAPDRVSGPLRERGTSPESEGAYPSSSERAFDAGPRFLLYSHDGVGLGHVRRNLAVATALLARAPGAPVLIVSSTEDVYQLGVPAGAEVLTLPAWRKLPDGHYQPRRLRVGVEGLRALRAGLLAAAVERYTPTVLLADKHPLGIDGELLPALEALLAGGGRAVLGLRDILDDPAAVRCEWLSAGLAQQIDRYYNRVLVYGQPDILNPIAEYDLPHTVASRTRFCGSRLLP